MIARKSFLIVLFLNLILAALWLAPNFGLNLIGEAGREPERLASQLHPEQLHLLGEATVPSSAPQAQVVDTPVSTAAAEASSTPATAELASAPLAGASAQQCVQWVSLSPEQVMAVNDAVRVAGTTVTLREESTAVNSYWVNIPPQGGKAAAEKRVAELRQLGLQDLFIVRDAGADLYAISLGLYRNEMAANRFFEGLQKKGVKGARITVRENTSSRIRLSGEAAQLGRLTQQLADKLKGAEQGTCQSL